MILLGTIANAGSDVKTNLNTSVPFSLPNNARIFIKSLVIDQREPDRERPKRLAQAMEEASQLVGGRGGHGRSSCVGWR